MGISRIISKAVSKTAKKATKKAGTLKPTKRGNMYARDKETGQVRGISKKTEARYDRMAEQKVKTNAKKAATKVAAGAAVANAAVVGGSVVAEKRKQNEATAKKAAAKKAAAKPGAAPSNTKGVSQRDLVTIAKGVKQAAEANKAKASAATSYKIKSGDTLSAIARANGTTVAALMAANPQIKDKDKIYAGRSIKLK